MIETIIAFFLFSSMMILYLPAFHNELKRMDDVSQISQTWRLFSELVDVSLDEEMSEKAKQAVNEQLILTWEEFNDEVVTNFECDLSYCYISLEGGSELYVEIHEITF